jgi:hypothetical protein
MQANGDLTSEYGNLPSDNDYRYKKDWNDPSDTQESQPEKNENDTQRYRYKGVNGSDSNQNQPKATTLKSREMAECKGSYCATQVHSTVLSLTETFF